MTQPTPSFVRDRESSGFLHLSRSVLLNEIDFEWSDTDLAGLLRHQLATPLENDLPNAKGLCPELDGQGMTTFSDLFAAEQPPRELLELTRLYAKSAAINRDRPLQRDVALVLYFAAIATGQTRLGLKLSSKSDADLQRAYGWALDRPWLAESLVPLLVQARG